MDKLIALLSKPIVRTWAWVVGLLAPFAGVAAVAALPNNDIGAGAPIVITAVFIVMSVCWFVYVLRFLTKRSWSWLDVKVFSLGYIGTLCIQLLIWLYWLAMAGAVDGPGQSFFSVLLVLFVLPSVYVINPVLMNLTRVVWIDGFVFPIIILVTIVTIPIVYGAIASIVVHLVKGLLRINSKQQTGAGKARR